MKYALALLAFCALSVSGATNAFSGNYAGTYRVTHCASGFESEPGVILVTIEADFAAHIELYANDGSLIADFTTMAKPSGVIRGVAPTGAHYLLRFRARTRTFTGQWKIPKACRGTFTGAGI